MLVAIEMKQKAVLNSGVMKKPLHQYVAPVDGEDKNGNQKVREFIRG